MLFLVFSIPFVQQRAAEFALSKLQPKLNTEIGLSSLRIRLFNSVELKGFFVKDQQQETLIQVDRLLVQFSPRDLFRNNISVHRLLLEDFSANIYRETPAESTNLQFIIDAFTPDTTVVRPPFKWHVTINDLLIRNGSFRYNVLSEPQTPNEFNMHHLDVSDFFFQSHIDFRNKEDFRLNIYQLSLRETNAGISLHDFNGSVVGMGNLLSSSSFNFSANNSSFHFSDVRFNTHSHEFAFKMESEADLQDVNRFTPRFSHLPYPVSLAVDAQGLLPQVAINQLHLVYHNTLLDLSASLADIKDPKHSEMVVNIRNLVTSQEDLQSWIRIGSPNFESPPQLSSLGDVHLQLTANGTFNQFHYNGDIQIEPGDIHIAGIGRFHDNFDLISFDGPVTVKHIYVPGVIGYGANVGFATVTTNAKVLIPSGQPVSISATGHIASAEYNQFHYEDIFFTGDIEAGRGRGTSISAHVHTETELNHFDLDAQLAFGDLVKFVVQGSIDHLDLRPFLMRTGWQTPIFTTHIDMDMRGTTMEDLAGHITLQNTSISDHNFIYNPGAIFLLASNLDNGSQRMQLASMFLEATIEGDYHFSTIGNELKYILHHYLPSVITTQQTQLTLAELNNNFSFNITVRNTEDLSYAFAFPFYNIETATLSGSMNATGYSPLSLNAHLPRMMFRGTDIRQTRLRIQCVSNDSINLWLNTYLSQPRGFTNVQLTSAIANDSISNLLAFNINNPATKSTGELLITMDFLREQLNELLFTTHIHPASISFNDTHIDFNAATIAHRPQHIEVSNFGLRENDMLLFGVEGVASTRETDSLRLFFLNTELFNVLSAFNIRTISGAINGGVIISQALHNPIIRTEDLRIDNIAMHNDTIGTLVVKGDWNSINLGLDIDAYLIDEDHRNLTIQGFIPTADQSPYLMGVNFRIDNFDLRTVLPFAEDIFSELSGRLNANLDLTESFRMPNVVGWVEVDEGVIRIAYTDVAYYISDRVEIQRDILGLNNMVIRDQNGNTATLNLTLTHANFGRLMYSANIVMDDFLLLNNERQTDLLAHGNLRLSGNLNVTGSSAGVFADGSLQTSSRSTVNVTIPQVATADIFSNVIFINQSPPTDIPDFLWRHNDNALNTRSSNVPIVMNVQLQVTPLLEAGVILDPVMGTALHHVRGTGDIGFRFDSRANVPVTLFGDYIIQDGVFNLNLGNLSNFNFEIRQGSSLNLVGNPINTRFNITAFHQTRADLRTLSPNIDFRMANTRVRTNALLAVTGDIQNMVLTPNIEIPDASSEVQQQLQSLLDNDNKMQQFAYLVAFGSFFPLDGSASMTGATVGMQVAANILTQTLDGIFADALGNNWSIGTTFQTERGSFDNVRVGADVSRRLLNDRLHIATNVSYADERHNMLPNHQAFMMEAEIEYEINSWLRLRVYNRSNDRLYRRSPITQGAGVVVTRQARTFENLFRFSGRRDEDENDPEEYF